MSIKALRTPDERFINLPGFSFAPKYVEDLPGFAGLRMHYLDVGREAAEHTYLCLHGEPTWAYLYRKMIPVFVESGGRVIAPDFFGFGRSDKPVNDDVYTFDFHRDSILRLIEHLELTNVTLVCQDWGGLIGLTLPVAKPALVSRLIVMNTALAVGISPGKGFQEWQAHVATNPDFAVGSLMKRAVPGISDAEVAAYAAPFVDVRYKAGVRRFPAIVPTDAEMDGAAVSRKAALFWSGEWSGPTFMAVGAQDPVLGPKVMDMLRQMIRGCPEPLILDDAGHFVQERGEVVAKAALDAFATAAAG